MNALLAKVRTNRKQIAAYIGWLIFCYGLTMLAIYKSHNHY